MDFIGAYSIFGAKCSVRNFTDLRITSCLYGSRLFNSFSQQIGNNLFFTPNHLLPFRKTDFHPKWNFHISVFSFGLDLNWNNQRTEFFIATPTPVGVEHILWLQHFARAFEATCMQSTAKQMTADESSNINHHGESLITAAVSCFQTEIITIWFQSIINLTESTQPSARSFAQLNGWRNYSNHRFGVICTIGWLADWHKNREKSASN